MNILLDTHILLWTIIDDQKLSDIARDFILDAENIIYYSTASIWEITIKHMNHPDRMIISGNELSQLAKAAGYMPLPILEKHVFLLETLKRAEEAPPHNDPFDRILIAQAKAENMLFLTHDTLISYYNEKCIVVV